MIELKARFPLSGGARRRLDLFAYLPAQLQINQRSLPRERFLSGVISHARYQVRREGLDILTSDDPDNPLWRLEHGGDGTPGDGRHGGRGHGEAGGGQAAGPQPASHDDAPQASGHTSHDDAHHDPSYELRMVCNLFHSALKEELRDAVASGASSDEAGASSGAPGASGGVVDASRAASGGVERVVARGRSALNRCERVLSHHEDIAQPAREYLWGTTARRVARTILSEESNPTSGVSRTILSKKKTPATEAASRERELLEEWLREIESTAERWGVVTLHADPDQVARDAELKKWVQSILYLPGRESNRNQRIFQAVAAVAAGLAMTVAVVATIFAESRWSGGSLPWALALIGAYIVKDRVKEGTRAVLVRRIPGLVQDRVTLLSEPDDGVRSPRRRVVARRVAVLRFPGAPEGWSCLQLQKRFTFRLRRMNRHHRVDAVVEILRVDVSDWLQRMDRAWKYWPRRTAEGELELASVPREYTLYAQVDVDGTDAEWYRITATRQEITDITALPEAPFGAPEHTSGSAPPME